MGISLEEYAKLHPMQEESAEQEQMAAQARTWAERQEEREQAEQLKRSILTQLQSGNDPQLILYTALKCIGLYSSDAEFTEQAHNCLDADLQRRVFCYPFVIQNCIKTASKRRQKTQQFSGFMAC